MSAPEPDYYLEIEAHFAKRRNTPFILSAKDWALMQKWAAEGVPLPVVIEAIDQVFENNETSGRKKVISSLNYCKHAVSELWKERKEMLVGGQSETPEEGAGELLEALAADVEAASAGMAGKIRGLAPLKSVPKIEEQLIELERELIDELVATLTPDELAEVRAEIGRATGDISRLNEKTRARTEEAHLRRIVRERFGVRRLTLFR